MNKKINSQTEGPAANGRTDGSGVPKEIQDAIDRVAVFVGQVEQAMLGDYFAATQVGQDVSGLVLWAFAGETRTPRFEEFLENRGEFAKPHGTKDEPPTETERRRPPRKLLDRPVRFHGSVEGAFDFWADGIGMKPTHLRRLTVWGIRTRWQEAFIRRESDIAFTSELTVFELWLGSFCVYFSYLPKEVLVRGYGWIPRGDSTDDEDGGGCWF